jgi:hypothetical protein
MKVHVRVRGESRTFEGEPYGVDQRVSGQRLKGLLSELYDIPPHVFERLVVDRNPESIVVRPQAVFG